MSGFDLAQISKMFGSAASGAGEIKQAKTDIQSAAAGAQEFAVAVLVIQGIAAFSLAAIAIAMIRRAR